MHNDRLLSLVGLALGVSASFAACGGSKHEFANQSPGAGAAGGVAAVAADNGGSAQAAGAASGVTDEGGMAGGSTMPEPPTPCADGCQAEQATTACVDGSCVIASCAEGFFDCDGMYSNGCEVEAPPEPQAPVLESPTRGAYTGSLHADAGRRTLRPTLTWGAVPATACGNLQYEVELDDSCVPGSLESCSFDKPVLRATSDEASFTPAKALAVANEPPVGALYTWRVRTCDGSARCSAWSTPAYFNAGRVREDLTGDGYGDAVVLQSGVLQVLLGSSQFDQTVDGTLGSALFNQAIAFLGDVNGDGFGDLGATVSYSPSAGSAPIVFFGAAKLADMTSVTVTKAAGGPSAFVYVAGAGDLNGDGFADLGVTWNYQMPRAQVRVFYGGSALPANPGLVIDTPLAATVGYPFGLANGVGDLNRDGYADLMVPVGWPPASDNNMEAQLYLGGSVPANTPVAKAPQADNSCMMDKAEPFAAGDLDGDGFNDAVVLCRGSRVGVYAGSKQPANKFALVLTDTTFATALGAFDLNDDGLADFAVGRRAASSQLFLGKAAFTGLAAEPSGLAQLYGAESLAVSDNDGDGRPDFLGVASDGTTALWAGSNGSLNPKPLSIYAPGMKTFSRVAR